ncbi:hypothetical protein K443DRAFT_461072 [Laccaria amethystina LaAM-08-1]|uniref:Uncharacterized protein n=1 Tax=Laccaria amethystina LaAM-08-1 TaxID=1095629 RepID=A0A0C9WW13_9AGAR|nr:hypothetical protein K443DRAFT_461072 [Laccaria amethystina LaAM-08-1]
MTILQSRQPFPPATKFGILLSPQWQPPHAPSSNSLSSSSSPSPDGSISSSSSSSSVSSYTSLSTNDQAAVQNYPSSALSPPPRSIRFAPLPDPRRSVFISDDGDEIVIPEVDDATQISCPATPIAQAVALEPDQLYQDNSSLSSCCSSKRNSDHTDPSSSSSTPGTATPASSFMTPAASECDSSVPPSPITLTPSLPTLQQSSKPPSSWPKPKSLSLFRPFKKSSGSSSSSSLSLTPTPSIERTPTGNGSEENRTLSGINLFRASSLDSNRENAQSGGGWGLSRWSSGGTTKTSNLSGSSPLARTQSTQSYKSKSAKPPSMSAKRSSTGGIFASASTSAKPSNPSRKGTRMLNGRVYGGPKRDPNANPFANARDEEPEFVEWGYGGMGSVKGAKSAGVSGTNWDRLHGNGSVNGSKQEAQEKEDENGDDGSGMGWVKKRREKKEREEKERKEKEEKEKLEQEKGSKVTDDLVPGSDELGSGPTTNVETSATDHDHTGVVPTMATAELSVLASDPVTPTHEPPVPRPTTPASTSTATGIIHPLSSPSTSPSVEKEYIHQTISVPTRTYHQHRVHSRSGSRDTIPPTLSSGTSITSPKVIEETRNSSSSASESESESDSEDIGEEDADAEDDDEEENDELENRRKTAFSAGVEKVSRFKDLTLLDEVRESEDLIRA